MQRRDFLKHASLGAGAVMLPALLQPALRNTATGHSERNLVIVHLRGGNDGLNTIVPYRNDTYYCKRAKLAIKAGDVLRLNDHYGFNPVLRGLMDIYGKGQMLVMNNVGYAGVAASHYTACRYWENNLNKMVTGDYLPGGTDRIGGLEESSKIDANNYGVCDDEDFEARMRAIASTINGHATGKICSISLDGFDTHQFQRLKQDRLLAVFANGIQAFTGGLSSGQFNRTLIIAYSEFGRTVAGNVKHGTEHGSSSPVFLFGGKLKQAGIAGSPQNLESITTSHDTDVSTVLETIGKKWLHHHHSTGYTSSGLDWI